MYQELERKLELMGIDVAESRAAIPKIKTRLAQWGEYHKGNLHEFPICAFRSIFPEYKVADCIYKAKRHFLKGIKSSERISDYISDELILLSWVRAKKWEPEKTKQRGYVHS
ncbi:hypothetical protein HYX16_02590 [Candidatus Woesearchaeota archaeon]|nr:hypothetical protein [Candidatus Woesearchaeota archaeon]